MRQSTTWVSAFLVLAGAIVCVLLARMFTGTLFVEPSRITFCSDRLEPTRGFAPGSPEFLKCLDDRANTFLKTDYAESKYLAKAFLTLLTAVFVASITFSEKIVNMHNAGWWGKGLMIATWSFLLLAIISCGTGLAFIAEAAYVAANLPYLSVVDMENQAGTLFVFSGLMFGSALASLLVAGVISLVNVAPATTSTPR